MIIQLAIIIIIIEAASDVNGIPYILLCFLTGRDAWTVNHSTEVQC